MSQYKSLRKALRTLWDRRTIALIAAITILLTATISTEHAAALMILTGADDTAIVLDGNNKLPKVESSMINLSTGSRTKDITLLTNQVVNIHRDGTTISVQSHYETVSRLLKRLEITATPLEMIAVDISGKQVDITLDEEIVYYDRVNEHAPYQTVRIPNPDMVVGTEQIVQEGQDGVITNIYEVVWSSGEQISRQLVEQLDSTAVEEIVEYGTAPVGKEAFSNIETNEDGSGILHFPSGATLEFTGSRTMEATAYTAGHGGAGYITAIGTNLRTGIVAVDKKVIPLGTKMYIITDDGIVYGIATAEDTGVRGDIVDLYYDTYEQCISFGRRPCTVYFLK